MYNPLWDSSGSQQAQLLFAQWLWTQLSLPSWGCGYENCIPCKW